MFIEPSTRQEHRGWIEVICGSMFSGKTEELIRRLKRARIAQLKVEIFKPGRDLRYDREQIVSHDDNRFHSTPVDHSAKILMLAGDADVIGIDEAQFFDPGLPEVCQQLAGRGVRVIVAGLDMDFRGEPFGGMPALMAKAEYVTKLHAICMKCGAIASFSFRKTGDTDTFLIGEKDLYEARCRSCFTEGMKLAE